MRAAAVCVGLSLGVSVGHLIVVPALRLHRTFAPSVHALNLRRGLGLGVVQTCGWPVSVLPGRAVSSRNW